MPDKLLICTKGSVLGSHLAPPVLPSARSRACTLARLPLTFSPCSKRRFTFNCWEEWVLVCGSEEMRKVRLYRHVILFSFSSSSLQDGHWPGSTFLLAFLTFAVFCLSPTVSLPCFAVFRTWHVGDVRFANQAPKLTFLFACCWLLDNTWASPAQCGSKLNGLWVTESHVSAV